MDNPKPTKPMSSSTSTTTTSSSDPPHRATPSLAATKTRIITHMNADHADSLSLFLRHYCQIPSRASRSARLEDITASELILTSTFGRHLVPLSPPLSSPTTLSDARPRLVAMHKECLSALDLSPIIVKSYVPPSPTRYPFHFFMIALSLFVVANFVTTMPFYPESGGWLYRRVWSLNSTWPAFARFCLQVRLPVLALIVGLHGAEAVWVACGRLRRHGVPLGSRLWWLWMCDCAAGGFGAWVRFDGLVGRLEAKAKANEKH